jgi:hyperosmotically inducible periplasmic protein
MKKLLGIGLLTLAAMAVPCLNAQAMNSADRSVNPGAGTDRIAREVRHELVMLPYYGVFDNLAYKVDGHTVTLLGEVTRPTLKSDAENVTKRVEGVERVVNEIKVLPLSPADDRIRMAEYRKIYSQANLQRYALQAIPPIHIIVDNGKVTLVGVVSNEADKNIAGLQANSVPGVFAVTNDLRVEKQ